MLNSSVTKDTKIYNRSNLKEAAEALKVGELVAFPTETVFGLGAIANNEEAVQNVFKTKGRPADNPLIVHVPNKESVTKYVKEVNEQAEILMEKFWPGPLTIIFPIEKGVFAPSVTPNLETVGIRMPDQLETLLLIEMTGFPLVGPSANLSGKPSPTHVNHVLHDFQGKIAGVVNNYSELTDIGIESTVVLPTGEGIHILRPGGVTKKMIEAATPFKVYEKSKQEQLQSPSLMSPGIKYKHYSPKQTVYTINEDRDLYYWKKVIESQNKRIGILAQNHIIEGLHSLDNIVSAYSLGDKQDINQINQRLFAGLRYLEDSSCEIILAQSFNDREETHAYMNRLTKAASGMI